MGAHFKLRSLYSILFLDQKRSGSKPDGTTRLSTTHTMLCLGGFSIILLVLAGFPVDFRVIGSDYMIRVGGI